MRAIVNLLASPKRICPSVRMSANVKRRKAHPAHTHVDQIGAISRRRTGLGRDIQILLRNADKFGTERPVVLYLLKNSEDGLR